MITVKTQITIDRPSDEVFAYISNFENNPLWQSGMVKASITSEGPLAVGSTYDQEAKFLGRPVISSFKVLEYEPGERVKASSTAGSFPITFTRSVLAKDDGRTLVTAVIEGDASGWMKVAEPLMKIMVQRSVDGDYQNLKRILEQQ